jgi:hypothetical protein
MAQTLLRPARIANKNLLPPVRARGADIAENLRRAFALLTLFNKPQNNGCNYHYQKQKFAV